MNKNGSVLSKKYYLGFVPHNWYDIWAQQENAIMNTQKLTKICIYWMLLAVETKPMVGQPNNLFISITYIMIQIVGLCLTTQLLLQLQLLQLLLLICHKTVFSSFLCSIAFFVRVNCLDIF